MRFLLALTLSTLLFSCQKASKQHQINFQIQSDSTSKGLFYKPYLNGAFVDSFSLDINGQSRFWYGWMEEGSSYKVELIKVNKFDTGWVNVTWYNGANEVIMYDKVYIDTLNIEYQNLMYK